MGGSLQGWDSLVPILPPSWRVIRYDMRGHGLSEKTRGTLAMPVLVGDAVALLDHLGVIGPVVPVGCAVGGAVALSLAAHFPERCAAVAALAPSTVVPPERHEMLMRRAEALERDGVRSTLDEALLRSYPAVLRQDLAVFERARAQRLAADPFGFAAMMRMLATLDMRDDLQRLRCPVTVIAGAHDQDRPPSHLRGIAAIIPGASFKTIQSGHFMALQTPGLVADAIIAFLRGSLSHGAG
jgi:3-oxoadipate enol-lactonase